MEVLKIKRCCASCQHKQVNYDGSRICMLTHQKVSCQMTCERWVLAEKLKEVTLGRGMVKRYEYLMFVAILIPPPRSARISRGGYRG